MDRAEHKAATRAAYQRLSSVWDETDDNLFNEGLERRAVRALVPGPLAGRRILDAGCASGAHADWFAGQGCHVVGFDLSGGMVDQARTRCEGRAQFLVADLEAPPFAAATFDGILSSLALHYLENVGPTMRAFARVLRPDGWLLVTLDHPAGSGPAGRDDDYFTSRVITDTRVKKGVEVTQTFWRRPLGLVVDSFADAGFVIERIGEPALDDALRQRFPDDAVAVEGRPTFIAYLARHIHRPELP